MASVLLWERVKKLEWPAKWVILSGNKTIEGDSSEDVSKMGQESEWAVTAKCIKYLPSYSCTQNFAIFMPTICGSIFLVTNAMESNAKQIWKKASLFSARFRDIFLFFLTKWISYSNLPWFICRLNHVDVVWCFGSVSVFLFSIVRFTHSEAATEYTLKIYTRVHNCISSRNSLFVFFSFGIHYSFQFVCSFSSLFLLFTLYWICVLHAYSVVLIAGDEIKQKFTWWHLTRIACLFIC